MIEKFSNEALKILEVANIESQRSGHDYVGTEQILIGLLAVPEGIAASALRAAGLNSKYVRIQIERIVEYKPSNFDPQAPFRAQNIPFTPKVKLAIERALTEAEEGHELVNSEHVLLAIISSSCVAVTVLENMAVDLKALRNRVEKLLAEPDET